MLRPSAQRAQPVNSPTDTMSGQSSNQAASQSHSDASILGSRPSRIPSTQQLQSDPPTAKIQPTQILKPKPGSAFSNAVTQRASNLDTSTKSKTTGFTSMLGKRLTSQMTSNGKQFGSDSGPTAATSNDQSHAFAPHAHQTQDYLTHLANKPVQPGSIAVRGHSNFTEMAKSGAYDNVNQSKIGGVKSTGSTIALTKRVPKEEKKNVLPVSVRSHSRPKRSVGRPVGAKTKYKKGVPIRRRHEGAQESENESDDDLKKKDKKLVFLSKSVLQKVRERPMVTGTQIANEILEMYKKFCDVGQKVDFKNVQRRVYDALNVLSAMDIIRKDKYNIIYNHYNDHIPSNYPLDDEDSEEQCDDQQSVQNEDHAAKEMLVEESMLTYEALASRERDLEVSKERVREKQLLLLELIKQQVAIEKLKMRNIDYLNKEVMGKDCFNIDKALPHSSGSRLSLPLLFVECQPNSRVNISQDDLKMHLRLQTDQKFNLMDENHLFQCMGLTSTNDAELKKIFPKDITDYLKQQMLVQSSSSNSTPQSLKNSPARVMSDHEQFQSDIESKAFDAHVAPEKTTFQSQLHTPLTKLIQDQINVVDDQIGSHARKASDNMISPKSKVKNLSQPFMNEYVGQESVNTYASNSMHVAKQDQFI